MKNFLRFLLVLVGVILFYIYNNPDVIDKYKTSDSSADKDSILSIDSFASDSSLVNVTVTDSMGVDSVSSHSVKTDSFMSASLEKPVVNVDTFVYSSKYAKENIGKVDTFVKKILTPYFKIEPGNNVDWYYAKTAPVCSNTKMVRCDHKAFYTVFGIWNGKVCGGLRLEVNLTREKEPFVISKIYIVVDNKRFDITSRQSHEGENFRYYVNYEIFLDDEKYRDLAWALYNAKSAKVLYVDNGNPEEMSVSDEELEYVRHGINMYIACGQGEVSQLGY